MDILIKLSQFLLSLSLLIILHELGHFIPAKLFKTRVEKFYLFFDVKFSLFKKRIGETVYGIGWLPLGGYVKIAGMVDESMDTDQLAAEPQPWEFRSKPAWQRLIIMLGGVTVNFILAFVIYIGMAFTYGETYIANKDVKDGIWVQNPILLEAGLQTGDKVLKVDGKEILKFNSLPEAILLGSDIEVERNGVVEHVKLPVGFLGQITDKKNEGFFSLRMPFVIGNTSENSVNTGILQPRDIVKSVNGEATPYFDMVGSVLEKYKGQTVLAVVNRNGKDQNIDVKINEEGKMEVFFGAVASVEDLDKLGIYEMSREKYSFFEAIPAGLHMGKDRIVSYFSQLKKIVQPETGAYKGVGGFKAIYDIFPQHWSWQVFWGITAMLSIMLGVMNLLPIPALDGGHVIFLLYEMISGRKPSDKFLENAQMVGFFILIGLLLFANGNDIYKAIFN